ncbi:type II toxin-antitoxin system Phd/YefM family antitoxin [Streptomyces xinghaiensis]|uniref:type II toxin-antitoxin system Phd/YefM family antitoxin n=1 Tax=Streptomyces xinghaiensis TaxID=1038928 RepID=UPI003789603D
MNESQEAEMGISDARANLTEVVARVRLREERIVLTRREKPQAVLVSADFYRRALEALGEQSAVLTREQKTV